MDARVDAIMKQVNDMQGLLATMAKEKGHDDGQVNLDAIKRDELEKMKADILEEMDKKVASSKAPAADDDPQKSEDFSLAKWMLAVKHHDNEYLKSVQKTAMTEGTPAQGGYIVPTGHDNEIYGALNDPATVISKCTMYPHGKDDGFTKNIPKWLTDLTVRWADEAGVKSNTKPTFTQKQSVLKKMYALITASDEFLADNTSNNSAQLSKLVGENFNVELERIILAGNTGGGDPFMGIGYAVGVNAYPQAGANLVYSDLVNIVNYALIEKYHVGAELYMTRANLSLIMNLVDGSGRPLWNLQSINGAMTNTCLGVKINVSSQTVATQIIYGNFKNVLIGYKAAGAGSGIQLSVSNSAVDADSVNYWTQDMSGYRFVLRRGVLVVNPEAFVKCTGVA